VKEGCRYSRRSIWDTEGKCALVSQIVELREDKVRCINLLEDADIRRDLSDTLKDAQSAL
jgi:glutaredoxin-related protein